MATDHFDDPGIPDNERLFRRINLTHIVEGDDGKSHVSSAAFRDRELSVNLESMMRVAARAPKDALRNNPKDLLMSLVAGVCRRNGQIVGPDPVPDEPAHAYVFGRKSKTVQRALRDSAEWIVPGEAPSWPEIRLRKQQSGIGSADSDKGG
jgi:hypothetical protein